MYIRSVKEPQESEEVNIDMCVSKCVVRFVGYSDGLIPMVIRYSRLKLQWGVF